MKNFRMSEAKLGIDVSLAEQRGRKVRLRHARPTFNQFSLVEMTMINTLPNQSSHVCSFCIEPYS